MDRQYDLFEKLPDGQVLWRTVITGRDESLDASRLLAETTTNEVFAMYFPTNDVIGTLNKKIER